MCVCVCVCVSSSSSSVLQANLDESQMSSSPFLRALMTAVCKAAVKGKRVTTWRGERLHFFTRLQSHLLTFFNLNSFTDDTRVDTAIIQRRLPVLLKYLNSDTERQLQALYALQALIVALDQPPSKCCFISYQRNVKLWVRSNFLLG